MTEALFIIQKYWLNRIANLVPLTRQRNSAAQNYDFDTKKKKYFQSKNGTSSYSLTTQVINTEEWTPQAVEKRQSDLRNVFIKKWELNINDTSNIDNTIFILAGRGGNASGYIDGDKFIVRKGSVISVDVTDSFQKGYLSTRNELISSGVVKNRRFVKDYIFSSASAAAAVILGRSAKGRREWTKLDGRTIAQIGH